ncbi:transposable element p transposase [Plakobranchus ocellatus]|uniref:Transposable element p transposase n=1 Tax=Plakobranchus ocellatus TaxID=259542 RepID=A0AAV4B206_9GAST|nr:transposable element p transposase [Plakobranchus ocellatus]
MLWDDFRENYGFRYLLTDRLNQDCLENLFSVIRGKGGHRFNSSPQEFRAALRQTMVDAALIQSKSQNCRGDIDAFLFSLDQVPSLGANAAVDSRLRRDVPKSLRPLMSVPPESIDLTLEEENVVTYIAGYIAKKIFFLLCYECGLILHTAYCIVDPNNPLHTFLQLKQFNACAHGGLTAPSPRLFST